MLVRSKNMSEAILAELPEMRAFARLMVNDTQLADDEVAAALTLAMSNKYVLPRRGDIRLSLFAILRWGIAQNARSASGDAGAVFPPEGEPATAINEVILQLSPEEREALILSVAADFSVQEIAVICECTVPAVRSRLQGAAKVCAEINVGVFAPGV